MPLVFGVKIETVESGNELLPDTLARLGFSLLYDEVIHLKQSVMQLLTTDVDNLWAQPIIYQYIAES
jgi:hypothetical protein